MKRLLAAAMVLAAPSIARADVDQDSQLVFGAAGLYLPAQNNLVGNVLGLGPYIAFSHTIECFHVGFRVAVTIATGTQFAIDPDVFLGFHANAGPLTLRLDGGIGPLVDAGNGFATTVIAHTFAHGTLQLHLGKTAVVEAYGGPAFIVGTNAVGIMAEAGFAVGLNF